MKGGNPKPPVFELTGRESSLEYSRSAQAEAKQRAKELIDSGII